MDLAELRKYVRLMEKAELSELEIDDSKAGLRVHLKRSAGKAGDGAPVVHVVSQGGAPAVAAAAPVAPAMSGAAGAAPGGGGSAGDELPAGVEALPSPMVGTFYRSPSPDSDPFVHVGTRVEEDSVLCIIEAMKVMNEIRAEVSGEIVEVLVENGEPVEFGQPLFLLKKS